MTRLMLHLVGLLGAVGLSGPALAQPHGNHQNHPTQVANPVLSPTQIPASTSAPNLASNPTLTGKPATESDTLAAPAGTTAKLDMSDTMSAMDHVAMGHGEPKSVSPGPDMETQPPEEAGSGPPRAADTIWGATAMRASRADLQRTHGDYALFWFQADRAERHFRDGQDGYLWDAQGYFGGTTSRFWFKSEGEGNLGEKIDDAEFQALYARSIAPFWDLQVGLRQDFGEAETTYGVVGVQGLAPYLFEVDIAGYLSQRGELTARVEAEFDQRITQRLILQPRLEVNLAAQDVPSRSIGAGIGQLELGGRLRYEITREFAPYLGVEQSWRVGKSADYAKASGKDTQTTNLVLGIRFWF